MKKLILTIGLVTIMGCGAAQGVRTQYYAAAGAYEAGQIVIEGIVKTPSIDPAIKDTLKEVDTRAVDALEAGKKALDSSNDDKVIFYTNVVTETLMYIRPILAEKITAELNKPVVVEGGVK